jgi:hypothetical protein
MLKLYESLDTPHGHIAVCFALILVGVAMSSLQIPKAEDIIVGSFGALLGALRGVKA